VIDQEDGDGYEIVRRRREAGPEDVGDVAVDKTLRWLFPAGARTSSVVASDGGPHPGQQPPSSVAAGWTGRSSMVVPTACRDGADGGPDGAAAGRRPSGAPQAGELIHPARRRRTSDR
jgi:hypothetical protein